MPAFETLRGLRVVASADALDGARWAEGTIVLRFAPDDALALDLGLDAAEVPLGDEHAIVAPETGFVGAWLTPDELADCVIPHLEWPLPEKRPAFVQGLIAGVPAKLWLVEDRALLLCAGAYAHELIDRLG